MQVGALQESHFKLLVQAAHLTSTANSFVDSQSVTSQSATLHKHHFKHLVKAAHLTTATYVILLWTPEASLSRHTLKAPDRLLAPLQLHV